jgi:hypothetical protein
MTYLEIFLLATLVLNYLLAGSMTAKLVRKLAWGDFSGPGFFFAGLLWPFFYFNVMASD